MPVSHWMLHWSLPSKCLETSVYMYLAVFAQLVGHQAHTWSHKAHSAQIRLATLKSPSQPECLYKQKKYSKFKETICSQPTTWKLKRGRLLSDSDSTDSKIGNVSRNSTESQRRQNTASMLTWMSTMQFKVPRISEFYIFLVCLAENFTWPLNCTQVSF